MGSSGSSVLRLRGGELCTDSDMGDGVGVPEDSGDEARELLACVAMLRTASGREFRYWRGERERM